MKMQYYVGGIPFTFRITLFALLAVGGIALQVAGVGPWIVGLLCVVAAAILMIAKSYRNKPSDLGYEEWKPVSFAEFQRVRTNLERSKLAKLPVYYRPRMAFLIFIPAIFLLFASLFLSLDFMPAVVLNVTVLSIPIVFSGLVKLWIPKELAMKVESFYPVTTEHEGFVITPYFRFDKDREGREIPEDVRFMIEMRRGPEDLVGIQLQVAINSGPSGAVPYMYAVYLCRGKGPTYHALANREYGRYVRETGGDDDYGTVVIRQQTSGSGYHTTESQCRHLVDTVCGQLTSLAGGSRTPAGGA